MLDNKGDPSYGPGKKKSSWTAARPTLLLENSKVDSPMLGGALTQQLGRQPRLGHGAMNVHRRTGWPVHRHAPAALMPAAQPSVVHAATAPRVLACPTNSLGQLAMAAHHGPR